MNSLPNPLADDERPNFYGEHRKIAIQSTVGRLRAAFSVAGSKPHDLYLGKVRYIDYGKESGEEGFPFGPIMHKRHNFADEMELRALAATGPSFPSTGLYAPVDLNSLLEQVRFTGAWRTTGEFLAVSRQQP